MSSAVLLDANVLIALTTRTHSHHEQATKWFAAERPHFATCPITQGSLIRFYLHSVPGATATAARELLHSITSMPRHEFWPDDVELSEALGHAAGHLKGHRQLTDAYLLALAHRHAAVLATFDTGLRSVATGERAGALELVASTAGSGRRS